MEMKLVLQGGHKTGLAGRRVQWWQPKPEQLAFFQWLDRERPLEGTGGNPSRNGPRNETI